MEPARKLSGTGADARQLVRIRRLKTMKLTSLTKTFLIPKANRCRITTMNFANILAVNYRKVAKDDYMAVNLTNNGEIAINGDDAELIKKVIEATDLQSILQRHNCLRK